MHEVEAFVAIEAPCESVERLVLDQSQRARFLPDGWRLIETLTQETDGVGSQMVLEWRVGPAPLRQVIELLDYEPGEVTEIVEGPPGSEIYVTTWRIRADQAGTLVGVSMTYDYGDFVGNFLVRRRLHRALTQMLVRLGAAAIGASA